VSSYGDYGGDLGDPGWVSPVTPVIGRSPACDSTSDSDNRFFNDRVDSSTLWWSGRSGSIDDVFTQSAQHVVRGSHDPHLSPRRPVSVLGVHGDDGSIARSGDRHVSWSRVVHVGGCEAEDARSTTSDASDLPADHDSAVRVLRTHLDFLVPRKAVTTRTTTLMEQRISTSSTNSNTTTRYISRADFDRHKRQLDYLHLHSSSSNIYHEEHRTHLHNITSSSSNVFKSVDSFRERSRRAISEERTVREQFDFANIRDNWKRMENKTQYDEFHPDSTSRTQYSTCSILRRSDAATSPSHTVSDYGDSQPQPALQLRVESRTRHQTTRSSSVPRDCVDFNSLLDFPRQQSKDFDHMRPLLSKVIYRMQTRCCACSRMSLTACA
jgi:hypothetical protein